MDIDELFSCHAHAAIDLQINLTDILGEHDWQLDTELNIMSFHCEGGKLIETPVQYVGTFSYQSNTFMWAWANSEPFHEDSLIAIEGLKNLATKMGISIFNTPNFSVDEGFISSYTQDDYLYLCSSLTELPFYKCPHEHGEVLTLLQSEDLKLKTSPSPATALQRFDDFVHETVLLDQKEVFKKYLNAHNISYQEHADKINLNEFVVNFDESGFFKSYE